MSAGSAVILAAGLGTRMKSSIPKVLHCIAGRPLLEYPLKAALELGCDEVVVVVSRSHRDAIAARLAQDFAEIRCQLVVQEPPRGTGDAARLALDVVSREQVLVLCGDTPLVQVTSLRRLAAAMAAPGVRLALLTALLEEPEGYGRVLRNAQGGVVEVREHRDCTEEQRRVREVNAGMYMGYTAELKKALGELTPANAQGEYYLTDVIAQHAKKGGLVAGVLGDPLDLLGVNDRVQLVEAEELLFRRIAELWGKAAVTVRGGARIDDTVVLGSEVTLHHGVCLRGETRIGSGSTVDVGAVLTDTELGEGVTVGAYSVLDRVRVGAGQKLPPFSRQP
jgi:bifunctional UDP-N-acetylglucosamine pyrophosphorylase/glucosamine-1-phosphate N-acetyltransferase